METDRTIAYFSMEIALEVGMSTYSGGLGVLAGDTVRAAADLHIPMVAVTLLHRQGYFFQRLDAQGWQHEEPVAWAIHDFVHDMPARATVTVEGRTVSLRAWQYTVRGLGGFTVPVYFLDADLPDNAAWDRTLTNVLYGGDAHYRLCQEVLLGIGGVRMLQALGYTTLSRFHMNEGHASLLALELLDEQAQRAGRLSPTTTWRSSVGNACSPPIPQSLPATTSFHSNSWNACSAPAPRFTPCLRCSVARVCST